MLNSDIKGHLKITKVYNDGLREVVLDDHNAIVSGMGLSLVYLFSLSGSTKVVDYQIDRYQIGLSGTSALEVSTTNQLSSTLSSISEYTGSNGLVPAIMGVHYRNNAVTATEVFVKIPSTSVSRVNNNTVRYSFSIDPDSCNNLSRSGQIVKISEVGLYMKNPIGFLTSDKSILVAYRAFTPIQKTDEFSITFDWSITF